MVSIFDHHNYREFLDLAIRALPRQGYGARLKLAEAVGCQSTYVSQVLKGHAHFNLEQAERAARFFDLGEAETECFLLLVQEERASTKELAAHFRKLRSRLLETRKELKNRFQAPQPLSPEQIAKYYGAWHYSAIHALTTIPGFRTRESIHERLGLSRETVLEAVEFLLGAGLLADEGGELRPGSTIMYLGGDSPFVKKHHLNWRLRSMFNIDHASKDDLHYSTVITISEADFRKVREQFVKTLESVRKTINESSEEKLCSLCLDFYEVA
jgi:uncharacterized protein (TIGR02147 family)